MRDSATDMLQLVQELLSQGIQILQLTQIRFRTGLLRITCRPVRLVTEMDERGIDHCFFGIRMRGQQDREFRLGGTPCNGIIRRFSGTCRRTA